MRRAIPQTVPVDQVPQGWHILDSGPRTIEAFRQALADARTILWDGTLGVAEMLPFAKGTQALMVIMAAYTQLGATTIIGGGDSAAAVAQAGQFVAQCLPGSWQLTAREHMGTGHNAWLFYS